METRSEEVEPVPVHVDKAHLMQVMRDFLATSATPSITLADFCALAGVTTGQFLEHYADIQALQMELVAALVMFDLDCKDNLGKLASGILQRVQNYPSNFWATYPKEDFDSYERNLLKIGFAAFFQQSAESAAIVRKIGRQHWHGWLQEAVQNEGFKPDISVDALADFQGSFQNSVAIATAFLGMSNRDGATIVSEMQLRYLKRRLPSVEAGSAGGFA
jgi:AcrR family transcriptional regulator